MDTGVSAAALELDSLAVMGVLGPMMVVIGEQ
jgi:hypothetical protein